MPAHFRETGENSIFGNLVYSRIIPQNHFLVKLKEEIPWQSFLPQLLPYYKGEGNLGSRPYSPIMILKMLFLAYLYNLSERQVEELANFNLPAKYFLGLGADEMSPDHASLTVFKNRLVEGAGLLPFEQIFGKIIRMALDKGIVFGQVQAIDATHVPANVNTFKDKMRREKESKPPRDSDAAWGVKHTKKAHTPEGKTVEIKDEFYGYKAHVSLNTQTGITTSLKVTPGNEYDGRFFTSLVKKDKRAGIKPSIYTADKAYDDGDNHLLLENRNLGDALCLKDTRTNSRSWENNQYWQAVKNRSEYGAGLRERYKIERIFGSLKIKHGLSRCRYLGLKRFGIQAYLSFATTNLKRIIKILTSVSLRNESYVYAEAVT